jgi:formylglycine-generating enzyme required for sulfatase activity
MPEEKHRNQVFISYSRRDLAFVEQLAADLQAAGLDVWYDLSGLEGGSRWRIEIEKAIRASQYVIVVLSPDSVASEWVEREYLFTNNLGKKIVPLLYKPCDLPMYYLNVHYIDVQGTNYQQNFDEILNALDLKPVVQMKPSRRGRKKFNQGKWNWLIIIFLVALFGFILTAVFGFPPLFNQDESTPEPTLTLTKESTTTPKKATTPEATPFPAELTDPFGVEMVLIPAGKFRMGSDEGEADEQPAHVVDLDAYYIDKYEVTNAHYKNCVLEGYCQPPQNTISYTRSSYYENSEFNQYPVIYVDWFMANTFCEWRAARLPTEAEWEKAARDGDGRIYPWGNNFDCTNGNFDDETKYDPDVVSGGENCDGYPDTAPVGSYTLNESPYGVYDMAGNVWEWVSDWYSESYYSLLVDKNPKGPNSGEYRGTRGGSWLSNEIFSRSLNRGKYEPLNADFYIGFRCAKYATP